MAYALVATGSTVFGTATILTPPLPSFSAGNLLLMYWAEKMGSDATPVVTGWTKISPGVNANQVALYGRIAQGGDTAPSIPATTSNVVAWIDSYSGNQATLTGIVNASSDRTTFGSTNTIVYPALTTTVNGCLIIAAGSRNKTSASDGATFTAMSGFTIENYNVHGGNFYAAIMNRQIQGTAGTIALATQTYASGAADATNQQYESYIIALLPAVNAGPSTLGLLGVG